MIGVKRDNFMKYSLCCLLGLLFTDAFAPIAKNPTFRRIHLVNTLEEDRQDRPHLIFPGGGLFFYWQAGVVEYLRRHYDLTDAQFSGASAGALAATLAATDADFYKATALALDLSEAAGVWKRNGGLQGVWGPMIREWLETLLPDDSVERVENRLKILVTELPTFTKLPIRDFQSKQDLIACNMASVHIPWFLDGSFFTKAFRNRPAMDGSFLAQMDDYHEPSTGGNLVTIDYNMDPVYARKGLLDFVKTISPDAIWEILEDGNRYAATLDEQGHFAKLPKINLAE